MRMKSNTVDSTTYVSRFMRWPEIKNVRIINPSKIPYTFELDFDRGILILTLDDKSVEPSLEKLNCKYRAEVIDKQVES